MCQCKFNGDNRARYGQSVISGALASTVSRSAGTPGTADREGGEGSTGRPGIGRPGTAGSAGNAFPGTPGTADREGGEGSTGRPGTPGSVPTRERLWYLGLRRAHPDMPAQIALQLAKR